MTLRKHIMALMVAIAAGCCYGFAAEKSFRIVFADNGKTSDSTLESVRLDRGTVNAALSTYLSEGSEYVAPFTIGNFKQIYPGKEGCGWIIGSATAGVMNLIFSEAGQVNATRIRINCQSRGSNETYFVFYANSLNKQLYHIQSSETCKFSFDVAGEQLTSIYISNVDNNGNIKLPFYLMSLEVFYQEEEGVTDPEMQSDEGSFASASSGTEFDFAGSRLRFDNIVNIENGAAMFNTDNRLTVSAPDGYFLAGIEFAGASAEGSITASSGSVTAGKWLPAEGDIALNAVEFTAGSAESLTGVKINYLPFRIDHSQVLSTIDFTTTEGAANSINIHSSFANSNMSTVESFIIRANGVQIAETQADATEATFTALPYLTDGRLTISPVINGSERQPELLEGTALPNLATQLYTIEPKRLLCTPHEDDPNLCDISASIRLYPPEGLPAAITGQFQVSVDIVDSEQTTHYESQIRPEADYLEIYVPNYLLNVPYSDGNPDLSTVDFRPFTVSFIPTYQFFVAEEYRSMLTASSATGKLRAATLNADGIQTLTFDEQQLQTQFSVTSDVSHLPAIAAAPTDTTTHYYTLQGIEVPAADLTPGLYLRRQGTRTTLHLHNPG